MSFACMMKFSFHFIIFKISFKFLLVSIELSKEAAPYKHIYLHIIHFNPLNLFFTIV